MPKRKRLEDLGKSQKYKRLQDQHVNILNNIELDTSSSDTSIDEQQQDDDKQTVSHSDSEDENVEHIALLQPAANRQNSDDEQSISDKDGSLPDPDPSDSDGSSSQNPETETEDSSSSDEDNPRTFKADLAKFVVESRLSRENSNKLLHVLRKHECHQSLPTRRETLVQTPRSRVILKDVPPGKYHHFGLKNGLIEALKESPTELESNGIIRVHANSDGLNLTQSSRSQFVPILGRASNLAHSSVFKIGVYHGTKKAESLELYLEDFVNECIDLSTNGFDFQGKHYFVQLDCLICDLPAKSYIMSTAGHTGYYSCTKCEIKGEAIGTKVTFASIADFPRRTHQSFVARRNPQHHHAAVTPMIRIPNFDAVRKVPTDYMHCFCLGCIKKIMSELFGVRGNSRLQEHLQNAVNRKLVQLAKHIPWEFSRRCRSMELMDKFKATEWRLFILYVGVVALKLISEDSQANMDHYLHFLSFHVAVTMLCGRPSDDDIDYCHGLLTNYIENVIRLHGPQFVTMNVHLLKHVCDDVKIYRSLDEFSAFPYENENGKIKRVLKDSGEPLKQLVKRDAERVANVAIKKKKIINKIIFSTPSSNGHLLVNCGEPQYKVAKFPNFKLGIESPNNCFLTKNNEVYLLLNIAHCFTSGKIVFIGRKFSTLDNLYTLPRRSSSLNIYKASNISGLCKINVSEVKAKCMQLPIDAKFSAIFPLIHTNLSH